MDTCIFCKIVDKEIPASIIYEDKHTLAFKDLHPQAKTHILIIPKKHFQDISSLDDTNTLIAIFNTINKITASLNLKEQGFRLVTNNGKNAGQSIFHLHFHILSDTKLSSKFN